MKIEQDSAVKVHYHLTDTSGKLIDSSSGKAPMAYLHGHNHLVRGVERALAGQEAGAKVDVEVSPDDGYGPRDPVLDVAIPLAMFPASSLEHLKPGAMFEGPHPSNPNRSAAFTVIEVEDTQVRCSANHPLAGVTLRFNLEVMEVRAATEAELFQGRVLPQNGTASSGCCSDPNCDK